VGGGRRLALEEVIPKPRRGSGREELLERRRVIRDQERNNKDEVRDRDPHCRWPHATAHERLSCSLQPREIAHRKSKGAGGNKDGSRNTVLNLISFCRPVHQGPGSIHAGKKRVEPLTEYGTRGPCVYLEKRGDVWLEIGRDPIDDQW
jgi:hypothetical protein